MYKFLSFFLNSKKTKVSYHNIYHQLLQKKKYIPPIKMIKKINLIMTEIKPFFLIRIIFLTQSHHNYFKTHTNIYFFKSVLYSS
jgi:hypothetical protein